MEVNPLPIRPQPKDRITTIAMVHHIPAAGTPTTHEARFSRDCETEEQPYIRRGLRASSEWQRLDFGWLQDPGMVAIANEEGLWAAMTPTKERQEEVSMRIIEVALVLSTEFISPTLRGWIVRPGESFHGSPAPGTSVCLRALDGEPMYSITAFPR